MERLETHTRPRVSVHLRILVIAICIAAVAAFSTTSGADAAATASTAAHDWVQGHPGYRGWVYSVGLTGIVAYRWDNGQWVPTSMRSGGTGYAQWWLSDWTWVWRNGAWHGVQARDLALWRCTAPTASSRTNVYALGYSYGDVRMYLANSTTSPVKRLLGGAEPLTLECMNGFPDARERATFTECAVVNCTPQYTTAMPTMMLVHDANGTRGYVETKRLSYQRPGVICTLCNTGTTG